MDPSGLQGAAQLLAAMAEGAGEVELFIATRERRQVRTLAPRWYLGTEPRQAPFPPVTLLSVYGTGTCSEGAGQPGGIWGRGLREKQLSLGAPARSEAACGALVSAPSLDAAPARGQRQPQEPRSLPPHWTQPQARVHICTGAPAQGGGRRGRRARQMRT